jgi:alkanesulfonate monooxygenase SsuD/methylene tetrahydromethanopterin reductase-like flavin-dependent oxidoreductase (luciferase family)
VSAAREKVLRTFATSLFGRGRTFTEDEVDQLMVSAAGQHVRHMQTYSAVGTPGDVRRYLEEFRAVADADELIVAHQARDTETRLRSVVLLAEVMESVAA